MPERIDGHIWHSWKEPEWEDAKGVNAGAAIVGCGDEIEEGCAGTNEAERVAKDKIGWNTTITTLS